MSMWLNRATIYLYAKFVFTYVWFFSSCFVAIKHSLWIDLSWIDVAVLVLAFLIRPSAPWYVRSTSFHALLGVTSISNTKSLTWRFSLEPHHLFLGNKFGAKYLIQKFHNSCTLSMRYSCVVVDLLFLLDLAPEQQAENGVQLEGR